MIGMFDISAIVTKKEYSKHWKYEIENVLKSEWNRFAWWRTQQTLFFN